MKIFAILFLNLLTLETLIGKVYRECKKEGQIAYTFDQGPSQWTGILLSNLAEHNIKATFHVVPDFLHNPVLSANLRRASLDGHLIGLFVGDSIKVDEVEDYLEMSKEIIREYVPYNPQFLRFPLPGPSEEMLKKVEGLGYRVTNYNLDSCDYNAVDERKIDGGSVFWAMRGILDQIIPPTLGSFISVQRDIVEASVMQMPQILEYAKSLGYKAVRLDTCLEVPVKKSPHLPKAYYQNSNDGSSTMPRLATTTTTTASLMLAFLTAVVLMEFI